MLECFFEFSPVYTSDQIRHWMKQQQNAYDKLKATLNVLAKGEIKEFAFSQERRDNVVIVKVIVPESFEQKGYGEQFMLKVFSQLVKEFEKQSGCKASCVLKPNEDLFAASNSGSNA